MAAFRAARQGLQALCSAPALAVQQRAGFTSLTLGSWWQGTASPAAANAAALGWQRVTALLPSLEDMRLLAAPKKKASCCVWWCLCCCCFCGHAGAGAAAAAASAMDADERHQ